MTLGASVLICTVLPIAALWAVEWAADFIRRLAEWLGNL